MMEYNNYYPAQPGQTHPPPNMMSSQADYSPMGGQMMTTTGPQMMQPSPTPSTPHSMQQTPSPMPTQQLMGPSSQIHPQQQPSPHMNYHQRLQQSPISHSSSPHPSSTPHCQQHPPRPSTGPSPLHHQSPIQMNGPSPKLHSVSPYGHPQPPPSQSSGLNTQMHLQSISGCGYGRQPVAQSQNFINIPSQTSPSYGHPPLNTHHSSQAQQPVLHQHGGHQSAPPTQHQSCLSGRGMQASNPTTPRPSTSSYMISPHHQPPTHHPQSNQGLNEITSPPSQDRASPFYQHVPQTEFRIIKLIKRLQNRPRYLGPHKTLSLDGSDEVFWWKKFANDFFDDQADLSLRIPGEDTPNEFKIGRILIPRFFKSYFDGGVTDYSIKLGNVRETSSPPGLITLDCDHTDITTTNVIRHLGSNQQLSVVVHTEGHLLVEFVRNNANNLLIKSWRFIASQCREFVDRSMISTSVPSIHLSEPVTKFGLTKNTFSFLKMCMIMEPMQDLMLQHRQSSMDPRACLKHLLFERYKHKSAESSQPVQPPKRRRRKVASNDNNVNAPKKSKASNNATIAMGTNTASNMTQCDLNRGGSSSFSVSSQDVLVVGEPILGADFGDENERRATRLENNQYDPAALATESVDKGCLSSNQHIKDNSSINQTDKPYDDPLRDIDLKVCSQSQTIVSKDESTEHHAREHELQIKIENPTVQQELQDNSDTKPNVDHCSENDKSDSQIGTQTDADETDETSMKTHLKTAESCDPKDAPTLISNTDPTKALVIEIDDCSRDPLRLGPLSASEGSASSKDPSIQNKENTKENIKESNGEMESPTTNSTDSVKSGNNKKGIVPSNKQNRRRSSERKETLREGLMRTSDFVIAMKDLKLEHPSLWRITTGNNLLQQFEPKIQNGVILFENTNQYAGWNPEIRKDYVGVDVRLTQHTRNQITVERLLLNFQKMEDADAFYDQHFAIYLQILISTSLDPKFWESIENDPKHHDYFITSRRIIDDIIKRFKLKIAGKLKLGEHSLKDFEKYPNLIINPIAKSETEKAPTCRACNSNSSTQDITFENRSYDLHTFKPVKVTNELPKPDQTTHHYNFCESCLEIVRLFSDLHHMGWKFFNIAREKAEFYRGKGKPINIVLDECLKDEAWMTKIFAERDTIWSKVEHLQ